MKQLTLREDARAGLFYPNKRLKGWESVQKNMPKKNNQLHKINDGSHSLCSARMFFIGFLIAGSDCLSQRPLASY